MTVLCTIMQLDGKFQYWPYNALILALCCSALHLTGCTCARHHCVYVTLVHNVYCVSFLYWATYEGFIRKISISPREVSDRV